MKIEFYSDIHLEWRRPNGWSLELDNKQDVVLVLAGDIGQRNDAMDFIHYLSGYYRHIIYVPGNHEYYGCIQHWEEEREGFLSFSNHLVNVSVLDRGTLVLDDVTFIGTTLWTNFHDDPIAMVDAFTRLSDFKAIKGMTMEGMVKEYQKNIEFLREAIESTTENTVVITHFPPSESCMNRAKYPYMDNLGKYFYPNVPQELFKRVDYWIYGHSHDSVWLEIDGCKIVSNQIGYPGEDVLESKSDIIIV